MSLKHSPAPWRWSSNRPMVNGWEGFLLSGDNHAVVLRPRGEPSIKVTEADAALIAAAPELLRHLQEWHVAHPPQPSCETCQFLERLGVKP